MRTMQSNVTAEQLLLMGAEQGRYELIEGELREMPPTSFYHGSVEGVVYSVLSAFVTANQLGKVVVGDVGFILAKSPDTVLGADVAYVSNDHLPADSQGFFEGPPDLVVEVVSPSDRPTEVRRKAERWMQHGVALLWVVHPDERQVHVYAEDEKVRVLGISDDLDGGAVLPGFRCQVAELFEN